MNGVETAPLKTATDRFRNFLAFFLISAFIGMLPVLIFYPMPDGNKEVIVYIIGQLSGMATTALAFYFTQKAGQDALDAKRTDNTAKALDAMKAVAENTGTSSTPPEVAAGQAADKVADAAADKAQEIKGGDQ